ncbi:MAG: hypothetical protein ACRDGV_09960 [Candidatus Limnocylindria bacterium]
MARQHGATCDIVGCGREATVRLSEPPSALRIHPRLTSDDPVPLCAGHAEDVVHRLRRELERADPNRNPSNRAMSSEDLGDAED